MTAEDRDGREGMARYHARQYEIGQAMGRIPEGRNPWAALAARYRDRTRVSRDGGGQQR